MKKIIALMIVFVMVFSLGGCFQSSSRSSDRIYIDIEIVDNGYGYKWLNDFCREFEELVKDKDYDGEGGKKPGVVCKVKTVDSATDLQSMARSAMEVFMSTGGVARNCVATGNLLDITDVTTEKNYDGSSSISEVILSGNYDSGTTSIADKMYDNSIAMSTITNSETNEVSFYTLPTYEIYSGMTFDKDMFDEFGFYFFDTSSNADYIPYDCTVTKATAYFVVPGDLENRSCGPDGVKGTYDDGMPSSFVELLQLYSYIKYNQVYPLQIPGQLLYEADFATEGLYTALLGKDKGLTTYEFEGSVDIVEEINTTKSAFQNEEGVEYLEDFFMPVVTTKDVTEETGFYTTWSVERYYALLFMDICKREGWFAPGYDPDVKSFNHKQSQRQFIFGGYDDGSGAQGPRVATMSTGSYWYNESYNSFTNFDNFYRINTDVEHRNLLWMPLPVNIFTSVTGEDGEVETFIGTRESTKGEVQAISQAHYNGVIFNDNVRRDSATYAALKDWIRYFHSDEQLEKSTIRQGIRKAFEYKVRELDEITNAEEKAALKQIMIDSGWADWDDEGNQWEGFYKQLSKYVENSYLLRHASTSETFLSNLGSDAGNPFKRGEYSKVCTDASGMGYVKNLFKVAKYNAMKAFEQTRITKNSWTSLYRGEGTVTEFPDVGWGSFNPAIPGF